MSTFVPLGEAYYVNSDFIHNISFEDGGATVEYRDSYGDIAVGHVTGHALDELKKPLVPPNTIAEARKLAREHACRNMQ